MVPAMSESSIPTNADAIPSRTNSPFVTRGGDPVGYMAEGTKTPATGAKGARAKQATPDSAPAGPTRQLPRSDHVPHLRPPFPEPGSTLGTLLVGNATGGEVGRYFTLGRLGRGTFCSIHKCVDLGYHHRPLSGSEGGGDAAWGGASSDGRRHRVVAAKVELSDFTNSGVLDGEATVLRHLSRHMPRDSIPAYLGYVKDVGGGGHLSLSPKQQQGDPDGQGRDGSSCSGGLTSAIIMEYLPGEDMHRLRDRHCSAQGAAALSRAKRVARRTEGPSPRMPSPNATRRLLPSDATYLTASVILPLIRSMHECGCIHRDVKPSNCVRTGTSGEDRKFKLVDFGLSKSFVVPAFSSSAASAEGTDGKRVVDWGGVWDRPDGVPDDARGVFRAERPQADFRGTSMYASLRVHQGRDYCRRDDVWGLLYVFCDLVSGGLPWMTHALERNRDMCQRIKEVVHGERSSVDGDGEEKPDGDQIALLLMGADYHTTKHKRDQYVKAFDEKNPGAELPPEELLPTVALPLPMASDEMKIGLLRKAFDHVANLDYYDTPDYSLLEDCLKGFIDDEENNPHAANEDEIDPFAQADIVPLAWNHSAVDAEVLRRKREAKKMGSSADAVDPDGTLVEDWARDRKLLPRFEVCGTDAHDPLETEAVREADRDKRAAYEVAAAAAESAERAGDLAAAREAAAASRPPPMPAEAEDLTRLPLELQLSLAAVEYTACNPGTIPPHLALRDWMALATALLYRRWPVGRFERGNHRQEGDGYKREFLVRLAGKCLDAATPFGSFTRNGDCFYLPPGEGPAAEAKEANGTPRPRRRKRKITALMAASAKGRPTTPRLELSRAFSGLRGILDLEKERKYAPPPSLSFRG